MNSEFMNRGYLLPKGCSDLIDVLQHKQKVPRMVIETLPPITGEIAVHDQMVIRELAVVLKQAAFQIVVDLMKFGVFAMPGDSVEFSLIKKVSRKYGYAAKKA